VETPDKPGRGEDKTPVPEISLGSYTDRVCWVPDSHAEPVILVGHSSGGAVISQAAEYRPDKVELLVYPYAEPDRRRTAGHGPHPG